MKHTPGPWLIAESDKRFVYALNDKGVNRFCTAVQDVHTDISELEANARLIAAAPELLEALQNIVDAWAWGKLGTEIGACSLDVDVAFKNNEIGKARAAIAKATGEQA